MTRRTLDPAQGALFTVEDLTPPPPPIVVPEQWAGLPDGPAHDGMATGKCLYESPARGLAARVAEAELWSELFGSFGCYGRSHSWRTHSVHTHGGDIEGFQLDRCEPTALACDLRRSRWDKHPPPACGHDDRDEDWLLYRSVCRGKGCDWEGPERRGENPAIEDGMDHAWPGWRDLPTVPRLPAGAKVYDVASTPRQSAAHKTFANWVAKINAVYPEFWLENGGPIRTLRRPFETRHVECHTPFGGFDLGVPKTGPRGFPLCRGQGAKGGAGDCGAEGIGPGSPWCVKHWTPERDPGGADLAVRLGLLPDPQGVLLGECWECDHGGHICERCRQPGEHGRAWHEVCPLCPDCDGTGLRKGDFWVNNRRVAIYCECPAGKAAGRVT